MMLSIFSTLTTTEDFYMPGNRAFGDRIRELREKRKLTDPNFSLRKFAKAVDISPTFLSRIERGEFDPPKADKIIRMAELLGIDADQLLALANKVDPELTEIIQEKPQAVADFLRTTRGMSAGRLREITERLRQEEAESQGDRPQQ
jgi:HTH-type transcriptional regulator, competence development regulator